MEQKARTRTRAIIKAESIRATQSTGASWNYSQFIAEANSFNRRLCADRSQRLPFIDNQTGVAQADCALWRTETERVRCQGQPASGGQLYSYPSRLKRGNRKSCDSKLIAGGNVDQGLFHLTRTTSFVASNSTSESSNRSSSSSSSTSLSSQPVRLKKLRNQEQSNLISDTARSLRAGGRNDLHHQQQPPRADSTGSHSFVDSDSRDQSSTGTSHSQESPRSQHLDDDSTTCAVVVDRHRLDYEEGVQTAQDPAEGTVCFGIHLRRELKAHENVQLNNSDWTSESIEQEREVLKSKLSKRKNVGSSLIKSRAISSNNNNERSLLIKSDTEQTNGRKTTQNNCNLDSQNGIHMETADGKSATNQSRSAVANSNSNSNGPKKGLATSKCKPKLEADQTRDRFRPYVCPICDQTYKTRPGLSYHFIHAHDTVLPRNLPVKVQAGQEIPNRKETKRLNDAAVCRRVKQQAKKMRRRRKAVDEKLSARVLQRRRTTTTEDQDSAQSDEFAARQSRCQAIVAQFNGARRHQQPPDAAGGLGDDQEPSSAQAATKRQSDDDESKSHVIEAAEPQTERTQTTEPPTSDVNKLDNDDNKDDDDDDTVVGSNLSRSSSTESVASISPTPADEIQNAGPDANRSDRVDDEVNGDDKTHAQLELKCNTDNQQHDDSVKVPVKLKNRNRNLFCDFCLGTADRNRRTRLPESLISCSDCGSSGHPSCLRFSDNIRRSVQKYNWQCIECKTCSTCNQADHEDQLLFCDDCDRSYHTYCLSPRLERPPEGNWTCKRCLNEYYTK